MAFYRVATSCKIQERKTVGTRDAVLRHYAEEAESILAGYSNIPSATSTPD
jgi:hypothetical protein